MAKSKNQPPESPPSEIEKSDMQDYLNNRGAKTQEEVAALTKELIALRTEYNKLAHNGSILLSKVMLNETKIAYLSKRIEEHNNLSFFKRLSHKI